MADIRNVRDMNGLIRYFSENLGWSIDLDDFDTIEDISYDFEAADIGLKEEAFARIASMRQLQPMTSDQKWGIFCIEFESSRFEVSAMRKILSGLIPRRRNSPDHAVWMQQDLLFICNWGEGSNRTIGLAHFEDKENGLPQIKMISCAPALEDFTQIRRFEESLQQLSWPRDTSNIEAWRQQWSSAFSVAYREVIQTSSALTVRLAAEAQNIRNQILSALSVEVENGYVHQLYQKFRETLIHDMTETAFADMYAQTVVYGLFSARCMDPTQDTFSVEEAITCIPNTNPFLKSLMRECLGAQATSRMAFDELDIGNVVDLLAHTNTDAIIRDFNRQTGGGREDPVIHFYEEFLTAYDKAQKVQRGVFYTPQPVVNFIVRAVDDILKTEFGYADGLASTETKKIKVTRKSKKKNERGFITDVEDTEEVPAVQVLDPATGTGTFIRQVILQIYENFRKKHQGESEAQIKAAWNEYVPKHLLPRINGFELMMAPYAVAHMKLAMVLRDTGYEFGTDARLNVCLTNTLEPAGDAEDQISFFTDPLARESVQANKVKKNGGISVLVGNPPYSTESANKGQWITQLMEVYKEEPDGTGKLRERNSKPINDDYVKFIRFGQAVIESTNGGVLAYINPHGYEDGPIFRGMRASLLRHFDQIYVFDLHGNSNRQETAPDGSKDENVFDIKQGVSIIILVKTKGISRTTTVKRFDLYGTRDTKYTFLNAHSIHEISWRTIIPAAPQFMFLSEDSGEKKKYESGISLRELFGVNGTGVLTKRDELCVHFTPESALQAAVDMATLPEELVRGKYHIPDDVRDWKYDWARKDVCESGVKKEKVQPILYRPFDIRYTYYTGNSRGFMGWPVDAVMKHLINTRNIALVTARSNKAGNSSHFFVSQYMVEYKCGERTTNSSVFPLFLCESGITGKQSNLNEEALRRISSILHLEHSDNATDPKKYFSSFDVFAYVYAVLYSKRYREKYGEFLNRDFPIVPWPQDADMFWSLSTLGVELINLHTSVENRSDCQSIAFVPDGGWLVSKVSFQGNRVYINRGSYFSGVSDEMWTFLIGGYEVLQRWFKDRKGQTLTSADVEHYKQMIQALIETQRIMKEIDEVIEL